MDPGPSRRTFSPSRRGPRDVDSSERAIRLRAFLSGVFGGVLGFLLGFFLLHRGAPFWVLPVCIVGGWAAVTLTTLLIAHSAGSAASQLYAPSSGSPPRAKEYSQAESLVARGLYAEAVDVFEVAAIENPTDPTPYLRVARIHRDHLGRYDDAARWFRRALRDATPGPAVDLLARKELVELYVHRMGAPQKALPELARLAEERAGTPEGEWAATELREIKSRM